MSSRLMPAVIAVVLGTALAVALFVPYVARQYRRRGKLGVGHAGLAFASLVYGLGLLAYVLLPFPTVTPGFCADASGPQLVPLNFLRDMQREATGTGMSAVLGNPALTQVLLNVALFVPLGMFVRHLFGRGVLTTTLIGLGTSLLIELTQGTGIWFLYPCPYRLFDVDDLLMNGLGALAGALAAPALRAVPGQREVGEPGAPRPVNRRRRLLASLCDLMIYHFSAALLAAICTVAVYAAHTGLFSADARLAPDLPGYQAAQVVGIIAPWVVLYLVLPLVGGGSSLGQRAVQLRVVGDGRRPGAGARLARGLLGTGGYVLLQQLGQVPGLPDAAGYATLLGLVSVIGIFTTARRRGVSCALTRLHVIDAREPLTEPAPATPTSTVTR
ncbi:VanZ family protein [Saccharopolyspora sp. CA-218241]|uniref:VanZ family protein n=1 Tax=Saccharopolyspora sp. CA-218241 TaxID=3240027 RepID=UPI003D95D8BE